MEGRFSNICIHVHIRLFGNLLCLMKSNKPEIKVWERDKHLSVVLRIELPSLIHIPGRLSTITPNTTRRTNLICTGILMYTDVILTVFCFLQIIELRHFPHSGSTIGNFYPYSFIETLSIPGLRRTSQQVTHCRGTKKEVAVLGGSTIRRTLELITFGIATIIKLLSARHSCKLGQPLWQRTMNQNSASSGITESTCLRSYRMQYCYSQKPQRPKKKWINGRNKEGFAILYTSCNFKMVTDGPNLLQFCIRELLPAVRTKSGAYI